MTSDAGQLEPLIGSWTVEDRRLDFRLTYRRAG